MSRFPPRKTSAFVPTLIYAIWKSKGSVSTTLCVEPHLRKVFSLEGHEGRFARYDNAYRRLHPEFEFEAFIREQKNDVGLISMIGPDAHYYDPSRDKALPFVVEWEDAVSLYR